MSGKSKPTPDSGPAASIVELNRQLQKYSNTATGIKTAALECIRHLEDALKKVEPVREEVISAEPAEEGEVGLLYRIDEKVTASTERIGSLEGEVRGLANLWKASLEALRQETLASTRESASRVIATLSAEVKALREELGMRKETDLKGLSEMMPWVEPLAKEADKQKAGAIKKPKQTHREVEETKAKAPGAIPKRTLQSDATAMAQGAHQVDEAKAKAQGAVPKRVLPAKTVVKTREQQQQASKKVEIPQAQPTQASENKDGWKTVSSKRKSRGGRRNQKAKSEAHKKKEASKKPALQKARPEAIVVKVPEGQTFAQALKTIKEKVDIATAGVHVDTIRSTREGDIILEMEKGEGKAAPLLKRIELAKVNLKARSIQQRETLEIKGLDGSTSRDELRGLLGKAFGEEECFEVFSLRDAGRNTQRAVVGMARSMAERLLNEGKARLGWALCRFGKAGKRPISCYRCWQEGHTRWECRGPDRSALCRNCGKDGHLAAKCPNPTHCGLCGSSKHREGAKACPGKQTPTDTNKKDSQATKDLPKQQRPGSSGQQVVTIASDKEAIEAAKLGLPTRNVEVQVAPRKNPGSPIVDPLEPPIVRLTAQANKGGDERYLLSRLREPATLKDIQMLLTFHQEYPNVVREGRSRAMVVASLAQEGLPSDTGKLKELYIKYVEAYCPEGTDPEKELEQLGNHVRTKWRESLQKTREDMAAYMSPSRSPGSTSPSSVGSPSAPGFWRK